MCVGRWIWLPAGALRARPAICGALGRASVNSGAANQRSPNPCRPFPSRSPVTLRASHPRRGAPNRTRQLGARSRPPRPPPRNRCGLLNQRPNELPPPRQVVSCEFDAMQTYPREQLATGAHIGDYTQSCMEAHGYDWNLTDKRCQVTTTVERNPYCYNSLDRLLYLIEEGEFSK